MEGRGGRRESQTLGKVGGEDSGEEGPEGQTGRCSCRSSRCQRGTTTSGMGDVSQVIEIRGSAASRHAAASVPIREPRSSELPEQAALRSEWGTQRGVIGAAQSRLVLVNPDELLAII